MLPDRMEPVTDSEPGAGTNRVDNCIKVFAGLLKPESNSSVVIQSATSGGKQAKAH